ncbi:MAG TPA: BBP7 family outer membrane beta-barrel protein [Pirellulales bacterium]|nr:BBP7 family outer membrane beta-barrel protein [Pirellulales bacterium]
MRTASVFCAAWLLWAVAAHAQGSGAETPSLLPLPAFAPPPLPRPSAGATALEARTPLARGQRDGYYAPSSWPGEGPLPSVASSYAWDEPTEAMPASSKDGADVLPAQNAACCGMPAGCQGCRTCPLLGGSPFAQALNTAGMAPLNLPYGLRLQPGYWFGSLAGLVMTRDAPNALSTTYNSSNVNTNLLDTGRARDNWAGGGQVMFGRWFGPQAYGFQFIYWGLGPMTGTASVVDPNYQLSTPFNLGNVNVGQQSATFYFDNAHTHALWRSDSFNNFEWNAMRRAAFGPSACRLMWTGYAGLRYFRFQDGLIFGGVNSTNFSDGGGAYAAYLNTNVTNNLAGIQLGSRIDYFVVPRVRLYAQPMVGLFGNEVSMREHLYSGDGAQGFDVLARRSTVSTLAQIDVGAGYQVTPRFSAFAAYRLMGVTRVGLTDNQIPPFWADQQGMQNIKTNGDLILHGVMVGGMWNF